MKKNIVANLVGTVWISLLSLVAIPIYVRYLGVEAFGLIGFFTTLQSIFFLLDFGLSATLMREMAALSSFHNKSQDMRDLLRSTEIIYWAMSLIVGAAVVIFSGAISRSWLKLDTLSVDSARRTIVLMGMVLFLRWPVTLYMGGLMGLQRQVSGNLIKVGVESIRVLGAVLVLKVMSPTVEAFFKWQVVVTAVYALVVMITLWSIMPRAENPAAFRWKSIKTVWRFAAGMAGISLTAAVLAHLDKIVLSKILSLKEFGYYSLASSLAMGLSLISSPISTAAYPRFTQLVSQNDDTKLKEIYHKSCQWIAVFVIPIALVVHIFAQDVLRVWSNNPDIVQNAYRILKILILGNCFNVLMTLPYTMQLAHKWTRLTLTVNLIAVGVLSPLLVLMARKWGPLGAASLWMILNAGYLLINVQFMHRRILTTEKKNWYWQDITKPLLGAFPVILVMFLFTRVYFSRVALFGILTGTTLMAMASSAFMTPMVRTALVNFRANFRVHQ